MARHSRPTPYAWAVALVALRGQSLVADQRHRVNFHTIHQLAFDAALVDYVGQLSILSADRGGELIRDVRFDPNARKFTSIRT